MKLIGIAGGSGAGKSTLSYALVDADPERFEIINMDDYQKHRSDPDLPMWSGGVNWDHPDIIRWDKLLADVKRLKDGHSVTIDTWAHRSNPDYFTHHRMIPRTIEPKPIVLLEGYLALYDARLNRLYDRTFYFDIDDETRNARRDKNVGAGSYITDVLMPMHKQYVEPSKTHADIVVDVSGLSVDKVKARMLSDLG